MHFTLFPNLSGARHTGYDTSFDGFVEWLRALPEYPSKDACPLVNLNIFGDVRTPKGSIRHDANILATAGVVGDYDEGRTTPAEAVAMLQAAGVRAVVVTTPSHGVKGNRWRVFAPFHAGHSLDERHELMGRLNTVLGGGLAAESFSASQAFYVGRVAGVPYEVHATQGAEVDVAPGIDWIPPTGPARAPTRITRAGAVDPLALLTKQARGGFEQVAEVLAGIPNTAPDWNEWNKVGMAVYNATGGAPEGLELWREWSDRCPAVGDTEDSVDARWSHYRGSPPTELGMGTLVYMSQGVGNPAPEPVPAPVLTERGPEPELVGGFQYCTPTEQLEHFKGCVYIQDAHRVFTPRGTLLKPEQFRATYGGYVFSIDATNDKTTKNAWEAFTESQAIRWPLAEGMAFRPELPPGAIVHEEGRPLVNTYVPVTVRTVEGDPTPFLVHLAKVLPNEGDRAALLAYMAACVQYKGVKFQWAPLIQGTPGNGKTLFTRCVAYAIGSKYTHLPMAKEISEKFNSWLFNTLFIGVEDIYVPEDRREVIEVLKPYITNDRLARRAMQTDQVMGDVRCNFIFNSNHLDAVRKTRDDRRFAVYYTAQQRVADIARDGMGGTYFPDLYDWLKADGYAIVAHYLATYPIPDALNPATACQRAPETSTTEQAIAYGRGSAEQEVLEAVEEARPGFAGGWVSSIALDNLLESKRMARLVPRNKRRAMMQELGYDWHPALPDGRVNNPTLIDAGKPRLYILKDHPALGLVKPAEVSAAYSQAQGV